MPSSSNCGAFGVGARLAAERAELAPEVDAEPDTEHEATATQVVERHGLARHLPRPPARERRDQRADPHAVGRDRDRGEREPRVDERDVFFEEEVVPHEEPVPTRLLGLAREIEQQVDVTEGSERREVQRVLHTRGGVARRHRWARAA